MLTQGDKHRIPTVFNEINIALKFIIGQCMPHPPNTVRQLHRFIGICFCAVHLFHPPP